ncbi:diguanylate cyclase (GGDEF) domain-containing protein [Modicisalibacter ilicicola DSM 19980]|uniref:diguanylate cyclase n=1 Tax=Modicisalibacter ilicicola DSM 19980 TaxID=1121942 RepID=A0A1M4X545_9GAMM|nr:GGDEF domain-containing protein [Halomonas ilicicola]SHE88624.1 diguanylate cyclase (GGDEF) domain-containing protein [Halomonas ilicicola DSM 19980]
MLPNELRQLLERADALPSLPAVVVRVVELARDTSANLQEVVETLGRDPALSARLLSLANTVFYAQHRAAEDLTQAVNRIGLERTLSLALGCSLVSSSKKRGASGFDLERYWQRSLLCAVSAKSLAESLNLHDEAGALFTASLLQDIGMLALHAAEEERYVKLLGEADTHAELIDLEQQAYGTDHAQVGGWLAERWQLSERTLNWIRSSHDPLEQGGSREQQISNCVIAAGILADAWREGEATLGAAMATLEEYFDLETPDVLATIMELQEQLPLLASLYDITVPERLDGNRLMLEAKQLLAEKNARLQQDLVRQQEEIERLRQQQRDLSLQTRLDPLTRVYNRAYIEEILNGLFDEMREEFRPLAVVFMDLDHFKSINDDYGHAVGDEVLKNFTMFLRPMAEAAGGEIGRYGGEEFVAILPNHDGEGAMSFAEYVRSRLKQVSLGGTRNPGLRVTASFGIATIVKGNEFRNVGALLDAADSSMYLSKRSGRDRITIFPTGSGLMAG